MVDPVVEIADGKLRGKYWKIANGEEVLAFLGIPYGKPPIGNLRFKAPLPAEPWEGLKDATQDGPPNIQKHYLTGAVTGSEDCLHLNVFTKSLEKDKPRPVMVFIYGGGFLNGANISTMFNPDYLLAEDVVLVVINYRLGMLGFLSLDDPSLDVPGNAGLKDQTLALKWVQKNISSFGGDHRNVTIFGVSAGSASVHYHILSPTSSGLFHKAILQSGCVLNPWPYGTANLIGILKASGVDVDDEESSLEYLRSLSAEEVFKMQEAYLKARRSYFKVFGPVVEKPNPTAFLIEEPADMIAAGNYNKVPMIFGYTEMEGQLFDQGFFKDQVREFLGSKEITLEDGLAIFWGMDRSSETFKELMNKIEDYHLINQIKQEKLVIAAEVAFTAGILESAKQHASASTDAVYLYRFSVKGNINMSQTFEKDQVISGATHGDDQSYIFRIKMFAEAPTIEEGSIEETTVRRMVQMWTNFATHSDPTPSAINTNLGLTWAPMDKNEAYILNIGDQLTIETEPEKERIHFWREIEKLFKKHAVKISEA